MAMNFPHWDYLLAIDRDLDVTSRYVEFADDNMDVFDSDYPNVSSGLFGDRRRGQAVDQ